MAADLIKVTVYLHCSSHQESYWTIALYVYKGLTIAFGAFLALQTRRNDFQKMPDREAVALCIYNVAVISLFGVPIGHLVPFKAKTAKFVLESCIILFCVNACQCIVFIPKVGKVFYFILLPNTFFKVQNLKCDTQLRKM